MNAYKDGDMEEDQINFLHRRAIGKSEMFWFIEQIHIRHAVMSMNAYKEHANHHIRQSMIRRVNVLLVQLSKCCLLNIPSMETESILILILRKWMRRWEKATGKKVRCLHTIIERDGLSLFICGELMLMAILLVMVMVDWRMVRVEH